MKIKGYKDLIVWQKSMDLVELVYRLTENFPKDETYGLRAQIRRSAVSLPSNIAEGTMRGTRKDFRQFIMIASGSGAELETQLEIAKRIKYVNLEEYYKINSLLGEVTRMLSSLQAKLKTTN